MTLNPGGKNGVTVAYIHNLEVAHSWHASLVGLLMHDRGRNLTGGWLATRCGTGQIGLARNLTVARFLEERDAEWLFWLDTDMGFTPTILDTLLEVADPVTRPVVGGLCFAQQELTPDGRGGYCTEPRPTMYDLHDRHGPLGYHARVWYAPGALTRVDATGSACILIHRSALEAVRDAYGPAWYDPAPGPDGTGVLSEDLAFCARLGGLDIPLHVHTGARTSHLKQVWLDETDHMAALRPPVPTERVAVLVPTLDGREHHAAPFMESLIASTGLATAYAIVEAGDSASREAWTLAGATVLTAPGKSFAVKVNHGYRATQEPWLLLVGDDVLFRPGWVGHALTVAKSGASVIGTNDGVNPRTLAGVHSPHPMIRRSYVDEVGAGWDGPGVVCHEGYAHNFVDDEIVAAAKQRGEWCAALGAFVEHHHPVFGGAPMDAVYELGQSRFDEDQARFIARAQEAGAA